MKMQRPHERVFLKAKWHDLIMLNYEVDPEVLMPHVPTGTTLDTFNNKHYVSIVGFKFLDTRILGFPIPFHRDFVEVNLRFYVKHEHEGELRRGVVFIKEIVPKPMITFVARKCYNENYVTLPVHSYYDIHDRVKSEMGKNQLMYLWNDENEKKESGCDTQYRLEAKIKGQAKVPSAGEEASFIAEHYWGYCRQNDGKTMEYEVEHPPWAVYEVVKGSFIGDAGKLYGDEFGPYLNTLPASTFVAVGSEIRVRKGRLIE